MLIMMTNEQNMSYVPSFSGIHAERCKQGCNRALTDGSTVDG